MVWKGSLFVLIYAPISCIRSTCLTTWRHSLTAFCSAGLHLTKELKNDRYIENPPSTCTTITELLDAALEEEFSNIEDLLSLASIFNWNLSGTSQSLKLLRFRTYSFNLQLMGAFLMWTFVTADATSHSNVLNLLDMPLLVRLWFRAARFLITADVETSFDACWV